MNEWLWWCLRIFQLILLTPLVLVMLPVAFFGGLIAEGPEASIDYAASVLSWLE
jgi:hypothetical protein